MIKNSAVVSVLLCVIMVTEMAYETLRMTVTKQLSAVHFTMISAWLTACIWLIGLGVHYVIDSSSLFGETWTEYSPLQLVGFGFLVTGQVVYDSFVKLPCCQYPAESHGQLDSEEPVAVAAVPLCTMRSAEVRASSASEGSLVTHRASRFFIEQPLEASGGVGEGSFAMGDTSFTVNL